MSPSIRNQITAEPAEVDIEPPEHAVIEENEEEVQQSMQDDQESTDDDEQPEGWLAVLQADTPPDQVHQRAALAKGGQPVMVNGQPLVLDYVTARFVQDRLDAAVGPANWQTQFESLPDGTGSVRCGISIRIPGTDEWVSKWDVGVPSSIEPQKGAHSDAFKRAAVHWGIARDLYDDRDEKAVNVALPAPQQVQQQPQPQQMQPQYDPNTGQPIMPQGANGQGVQQMGMQQWACPIHDDSKVVPGGVSKRTGRPYRAFYACPVAGCDQKGPSL
jgi:hypothetical protein